MGLVNQDREADEREGRVTEMRGKKKRVKEESNDHLMRERMMMRERKENRIARGDAGPWMYRGV